MRAFLVGLTCLAIAAAMPHNSPAYGGNGRESGPGSGSGDGDGGYGDGGYGDGGYGGSGYGPGGAGGGVPVCLGLAGTPQCCQLNALGLAALPCDPPHQQPWDKLSFNQICAATGRSAQCCVLSGVAGAGLVCNQP